MGTHWRSMMDKTNYLGSWDLIEGRDVVVKIREVKQATELAGKQVRKPILYFDGKDKGLVLNPTMCKTMQRMYGPHVEDWRGKWIALYVTTTGSPDGEVPCIRVRPTPPRARQGGNNRASAPAEEAPPAERQPGDDDGPPADEAV